ncbi:DUF1178 family protein [Microvirga massiliensis]|uniref:DUF1178 family protein n=1 Tax=Microvirga massiliensis TaxID=1033741 RepID=UPI00062B6840|nr:DUF1178 family protein [Microvirga massiliensis]
MIKYSLACESGHEFESWFPSSDAFETQRKRGFVSCPVCQSTKVEKQIMAPSVARKDRAAPQAPNRPMAVLSEQEVELRKMLRALRDHVEKHAENVGDRFAEEARSMHLGEIEHRSIYGQASPTEARELIEEGIEILPLPMLPDSQN